jgi:hypothetical protein
MPYSPTWGRMKTVGRSGGDLVALKLILVTNNTNSNNNSKNKINQINKNNNYGQNSILLDRRLSVVLRGSSMKT